MDQALTGSIQKLDDRKASERGYMCLKYVTVELLLRVWLLSDIDTSVQYVWTFALKV